MAAETITIRTNPALDHALEILTADGTNRSAAITAAVVEAAQRRERAAAMRRAVLQMPRVPNTGVSMADEIIRERYGDER
ncbi:MAG: hypothetical protein ACJ786_07855 [Catenulispora sp.]